MEISEAWAPLLVSAIRDAVLYNEQLLKSETLRNRADYEEHMSHLTQLLEYVKEEYKAIEDKTGIPLERLL